MISGEPLRVRLSEGTDLFLDEVVRNDERLAARLVRAGPGRRRGISSHRLMKGR